MFARTQRTARLRFSPIAGFLALALFMGGAGEPAPSGVGPSMAVAQAPVAPQPEPAVPPGNVIAVATPDITASDAEAELPLTIEFQLPKRTTAGLLTEIRVKVSGIHPKAKVRWELPDAEYRDSDNRITFTEVAHLSELGRVLRFAWPVAGPLKFRASARKPIIDDETQVAIDFDEVVAEATFVQTGGAIGPDPLEPVIAPADPSIKAAVGAVSTVLAGHADVARELQPLYGAIAKAISRGACKTTEHARRLHIDAAKYTTYGQLSGKVPGLRDAVEKFLTDSVGLDGATMDDPRRAKWAAAFSALEWACSQVK